jgi:DNA-binding transcriptional LysR family regulator
MVEDCFLEKKIHRQIALQVPHFSAVPKILKRTGWAVTLPRRAARFFNDANEFAILDLPIDIPEVEVTLHWHPDFEESEANQWLRRQIAELLAE